MLGIDSKHGAIAYNGPGENHEAFADPATAFTLTVRARDGKTHTDVTVIVRVTDVDGEAPDEPVAPSVSATANSATELDVSWNAPGNTGPAITGYDVRYRAGAAGDFTDGPRDVTTTSATLTHLQPDTSHEVQVRATNDEGVGPWSDSGTGTTGPAPPTVSLSAAPNPVTEGSPVTVTATLSQAATNDVTVPLTLAAVTAEDGDHGPLDGVTIDAGATTGAGTVTTAEDDDADDETFTVSLGALPADLSAGSPASVTVTIADDDRRPSFGAGTVPDQSWVVNAPIETLTLPEAAGGDGPLRYELSPDLPAGVTLDGATRRVSGAPTVSLAPTTYTWTATDSGGDSVSLTFTITVAAPVPALPAAGIGALCMLLLAAGLRRRMPPA